MLVRSDSRLIQTARDTPKSNTLVETDSSGLISPQLLPSSKRNWSASFSFPSAFPSGFGQVLRFELTTQGSSAVPYRFPYNSVLTAITAWTSHAPLNETFTLEIITNFVTTSVSFPLSQNAHVLDSPFTGVFFKDSILRANGSRTGSGSISFVYFTLFFTEA